MTLPDPVEFSTEVEYGSTTCGYGLQPADMCHQTATHHLYYGDELTVPACNEHTEWLRTCQPQPLDEHPRTPNCGMPGTLWRHSDNTTQGYCFVPTEPTTTTTTTREQVPAT